MPETSQIPDRQPRCSARLTPIAHSSRDLAHARSMSRGVTMTPERPGSSRPARHSARMRRRRSDRKTGRLRLSLQNAARWFRAPSREPAPRLSIGQLYKKSLGLRRRQRVKDDDRLRLYEICCAHELQRLHPARPRTPGFTQETLQNRKTPPAYAPSAASNKGFRASTDRTHPARARRSKSRAKRASGLCKLRRLREIASAAVSRPPASCRESARSSSVTYRPQAPSAEPPGHPEFRPA